MKSDTSISNRQLRAIGHKLKPVVTVAQNGISEGILLELQRALTDHELIKVKIPPKSSGSHEEIIDTICKECSAKLVHQIGNVLLIVRRNDNPDPRLSNLIRTV